MVSTPFERDFAAGRVLFRQGEAGDCAYVLKTGRVAVLDDRTDPPTVLAVLGPGEVIGEMSLLDGRPRSATVRALDACSAAVITRDQLARRLDRTDAVVRVLFEIVLQRFRHSDRRRAEGAQMRPAQIGAGGSGAGSDLGETLTTVLAREQALQRALERQEFRLFLQPIVLLATGQIGGFEALIRWDHPDQGVRPPGEFVPLLEESDLIIPLGAWLVTEGLHQQGLVAETARRARPDAPEPFISINVSARQFHHGELFSHLSAALDTMPEGRVALDAAPVPSSYCNPGRPAGPLAGKLKLEITESVLIDNPDSVFDSLHRCRALGASIALDDFGTGYASLGYLQRFPIDTLKIDRSFVGDLQSDTRSLAITRGIIDLARGLAMDVVAEGIETDTQCAALHRLGCAMGQGYLFGKPMPLAAALRLLETWQPERFRGGPVN